MTRQRGASGVFLFVLMLLAMLVLMAMLTLSRTSSNVDAQAQTIASLRAAAAALEQYASVTGRLPCPADPRIDTGLASPNGPSVNCDFPQPGVGGSLPWQTIGMRRDDAYDAWGWKISYRVYTNVAGSMTQANGASMVNCDTVQAFPLRQPVDATKLCPAAHDTIDSDFIAGKGLTVTDFGTTYDGTSASGGAAYVLISHGFTGFGAYTAAGTQRDAPKSTEEKNNLKDTGPFVAMAASAPDVAPDDTSHYDDILLYRTVADLAKRANLAARDWPDDVLMSERFDLTRVGQVLGSSPSGDLGVSTLTFAGVTVSAFDSGGAQDLAFTSSGTSGLGGASGGSNNLTSTGGEGLRFDLTQSARQFSASLGSFTSFERVEVKFFTVDPTTFVATLVGTVDKIACGSASVSSFTIDPGVAFNRVEVRPITSLFFGLPSSVRVAEVRTCIASVTCQTTLYPTGDVC